MMSQLQHNNINVSFRIVSCAICCLVSEKSRTKIENLTGTIGKDINFGFFGEFVTVLVQKVKKNVNKLVCSQYFDSQFSPTK